MAGIYYNVLGVDPNPTPEDIKKAYYMKARLFLQDMSPEHSKAPESSQVVGDDHQDLRPSDDYEGCYRHGMAVVPREIVMDPSALFGMLFGSDMFDDYVGRLAISSLASIELEEDTQDCRIRKERVMQKLRALQQERVDKLVTIMKTRLQLFVAGQRDEFLQWVCLEAQKLSEAAFGNAMLRTIGYVYTRKAAKELGKDKRYMKVPYVAECVRRKGHNLKSHVRACSGMLFIAEMEDQLKKLNIGENKDESLLRAIDDKRRGVLLHSLWQINVAEIETTLSLVCEVVLKDPLVSSHALKLRAKALKKVGKIFHGVKDYREHPSPKRSIFASSTDVWASFDSNFK